MSDMNDPCAGPGATHSACWCVLKRLAILEEIASISKEIIYRHQNIYAPESKKGRLKIVLDRLDALGGQAK